MRIAALISGGKDSMLAAHKAAEQHDLCMLIGVVPDRDDSYMFHTVNLHMLDVIAECMRLPLKKVRVSGEEEKEVDELVEQLKDLDVDGICIGGLESEYQRKRFEKVCKSLGLKMLAPLWKADVEKLMKEVAEKFEAIIVSVAAMGLDETFLGRRIDEKCIEDLKKLREKYGIHLAGEGGEYETLVLDAPLYKERIVIERAERVWMGNWGYLRIDKFRRMQKLEKCVSKN